jgi:citrate synthase
VTAGDRPASSIAQAVPDRVEVRGRDLVGLMGEKSFTEYFHLLLTGQEPTEEQRFFLDLVLVALAEHGMMPSNVAARMTLAAAPDALQGAVAAGILGAGPVLLGTSGTCARLLASGRDAGEIVRDFRAAGDRIPGFGHPVHKPVDPRAERIFELADARGVSGEHVRLARELGEVLAPLTLNVSMAIAAVMLDLGFPLAAVDAVPLLARTASLLAHLAEERELPTGLALAAAAEDAVDYRRAE